MNKPKYIAVEGPIGVGKTTLVELLTKGLNAKPLLEEVAGNPFLPKFYENIKKYSFQTQTFFLLSRYKQQQELSQVDLFDQSIISDYLFAKDRIFAYLTLDENELGLYEQIFRLLDARIPKPDLVIYLQAPSEVLIGRIDKRHNEYERGIEETYLEDLVEAYNKYFFYYTDTPLLVVNTTEVNFEENPEDLSNLLKEIESIKGGTHHYIPLGSKA